jgi:hypothetical protein
MKMLSQREQVFITTAIQGVHILFCNSCSKPTRPNVGRGLSGVLTARAVLKTGFVEDYDNSLVEKKFFRMRDFHKSSIGRNLLLYPLMKMVIKLL